MLPDFFAQIILLSGFFVAEIYLKVIHRKWKNKKFTQCLAGGGIRVIIIDMWIITKKKNLTGEFEFCSKI